MVTVLFRYALLILPLSAVGLWTVWPLIHIGEQPVSTNLWVLVIISALANLYILFYHYTTPAHPKFLMLRGRRIWLRIHIISGSLEFLAGVILLLFPGQTWPGLVMAITALVFHVPSSFAQNRIVAGSRALMIPTYVTGISAHGFSAFMLLLHPNSVFWAVNTFILFNTYAWVRIYGFLSMKFNLFGSARYTVMVLGAGATTMTPVLGTIWPMQLGLFLLIYIAWFKFFFARTPEEFENFVREHSRWSGINAEVADLWATPQRQEETKQQAKEVFDFFDQKKQGFLEIEQLKKLLASWALPPEALDAFLEKIDCKGNVTFETFLQKIWSVSSVRKRASLAVKIQSLPSLRDKAQFIFDLLDLDKDGTLKPFEFKLLLLEWNLPPDETEKYLAICAQDGEERIDFETFYHRMQPVWQYLFYNVFGSQVEAENLFSGSSSTFEQDKREANKRYIQTKQELINKVYFLRDAPPNFLKDLAESFQTETFAEGQEIIREWMEADRFYILVEGTVYVMRQGLHLSTLHQGASFGESAFLFHTRRNASVIAATPVTLYAISRTSFFSLIKQYPSMQVLLERMALEESQHRIHHALQSLLQVQKIPDLNTSGLVEQLAGRVKEVCYVEGEDILVEGEPGDSFFIIQSGLVSVHRGQQELVRYGVSDCFGEAALLSKALRNATITALTETVLFKLHQDDFYEVLDTQPSFKHRILQLHELRS